MLQTAKRMIAASGRSDVPPFMVMDVMAAAARLEAAGTGSSTWKSASRRPAAPATALAAARSRAAGGRLGYTEALGRPSAAGAHRAPLRGDLHASTSLPSAWSSPPARPAGSSSPSSPLFEAGDRVAIAVPGYPPYRHILTALGCDPGRDRDRARRRAGRITPEALMAAHRQAPLKGVLVASPANPTGTMMSRRGACGARSPPPRMPASPSSPTRSITGSTTPSRRRRRCAVRPGARCINSFSKSFCMTGLADRLAGAAGGAGAPGRADAQNLAISCRRCRRSRPRRRSMAAAEMEAVKARLRAQPPHPGRAPAAAGLDASCRSTAPSISMPTCRASRTTRRVRPAPAGRGGRRGDAGRRFRSGQRSQVHPLLLRRRARRHRARRRTDGDVAEVDRSEICSASLAWSRDGRTRQCRSAALVLAPAVPAPIPQLDLPRAVTVVLGLIAGYVDAFTFLGLFGFFIAQTTGSFVYVGTSLVSGPPVALAQIVAVPVLPRRRGDDADGRAGKPSRPIAGSPAARARMSAARRP